MVIKDTSVLCHYLLTTGEEKIGGMGLLQRHKQIPAGSPNPWCVCVCVVMLPHDNGRKIEQGGHYPLSQPSDFPRPAAAGWHGGGKPIVHFWALPRRHKLIWGDRWSLVGREEGAEARCFCITTNSRNQFQDPEDSWSKAVNNKRLHHHSPDQKISINNKEEAMR